MASNSSARAREVAEDRWDWLVASDPGLNRLRMATRGLVAMGSTLGVEWLIARYALGESSQNSLIAMLLGAVVAMMGSMGLSAGSPRTRAATATSFPIAMAIGMVLGTAVAGNTDVLLGVFVVVLFVATYVRRFGQTFFFAGFMTWMGYFFASFMGASFSELPTLILYAAVAALWVLLLSLTLLQENPTRTLRHTLRAFTIRAEALSDAAADLLAGRRHAARWLARQHRRMNETALMVEGQLANDDALPANWSAQQLRHWLTDAELALDEITLAAAELARSEPEAELSDAAWSLLRRLADGSGDAARRAAVQLGDRCAGRSGQAAHAAHRLTDAVLSYSDAVRQWAVPAPRDSAALVRERAGEPEFVASVTMTMGRLPNSNAVAREVAPRSASWNPLARLPMTTRQAIQVAVAGALAIAAGRALSEQRYYWAVIAAFVAFTGTATRGETFAKALNRVVGTAVGLFAAILLANLTAGQTPAVLIVILASMFLGFYLQQISYAFMIFFITIMIAQLYSVLHEFSDQLLLLRLEETAIGAAIGVLVAVLVLPLSTTETSKAARRAFYAALGDLLAATAQRLSQGPDRRNDAAEPEAGEPDLDGLARSVDSQLWQLTQILQPLTSALALGVDADRIRERLALYSRVSTAARALASAARQPGAHSSVELAGASRHLASAARQLAEPSEDNWQTGLDEDCLQAAQSCLDAEADQLHSHPMQAPLAGLLLVLRRLCDGAQPSNPDRRADPVAAPRGLGADSRLAQVEGSLR